MFLYNIFSVISKPRFELIFCAGGGGGEVSLGKEINKIRGFLVIDYDSRIALIYNTYGVCVSNLICLSHRAKSTDCCFYYALDNK